jgi:hypothetical protein
MRPRAGSVWTGSVRTSWVLGPSGAALVLAAWELDQTGRARPVTT